METSNNWKLDCWEKLKFWFLLNCVLVAILSTTIFINVKFLNQDVEMQMSLPTKKSR